MEKPDNTEISEILELIKTLELHIEDNNQNIKDCVSLIKDLKRRFHRPKKSFVKTLIRKILNKTCMLSFLVIGLVYV
jgi:hypothetical protein